LLIELDNQAKTGGAIRDEIENVPQGSLTNDVGYRLRQQKWIPLSAIHEEAKREY
jgi:hypothetical protein